MQCKASHVQLSTPSSISVLTGHVGFLISVKWHQRDKNKMVKKGLSEIGSIGVDREMKQ